MERRALLLNSVLLRQNPHNVSDWLHRVELLEPQGPRKQIEAFMEGISSVDPGCYSSFFHFIVSVIVQLTCCLYF